MKITNKWLLAVAALLLAVGLICGCAPKPASTPAPAASVPTSTAPAQLVADKNIPKPSDTIEFVSCFGPGGGHDTMLRNMEAALRANKLMDNPIIYTYKPGGAMAVGMAYTYEKAGRIDTIMSTTSQLVKTPLQMDIGGFGWRDMTPICLWGKTVQFLFVRGDIKEQTMDELLNSGRPLSFYNSGAGTNEEYVALRLAEMVPHADIVSVPIDGDAEALTQLLGGHIDVMPSELGDAEEFLKTGELRALCTSSPERSVFLPDVPTLKELGYDIGCSSFRGVMGPPNMPQEAVAFYVDLFKEVSETKEFQQYMESNGVEPNYLTGNAMIEYLEEYEDMQIEAFKLAGLEILPQYLP
jgi:putative tricarboxylic transport membrane protein